MNKGIKTYFQDIHYSRKKPGIILDISLNIAEFFYKNIISVKNFLYEKKFLKEKKVNAYVICIGNLTTGGVGKTPITTLFANDIYRNKKVAVISRGYGSKLNTKVPQIIKDYNEIKYENGLICGDEPYQTAKKAGGNTVVIICKDRYLSCKKAIDEYGSEIIIMDDGFSNRKISKDRTILVVDSKMKFGNEHLLPKGPLREPLEEIKRCDEIIIANKQDNDIQSKIEEFKKFNKKLYLCNMSPKRIYNIETNATVKQETTVKKAIAFCAIGQPGQFFEFAKSYYDILSVSFEDHHKYTKNDIKNLITLAEKEKTNIFITTQKDETKIKEIIKQFNGYIFNVLELENTLTEVK